MAWLIHHPGSGTVFAASEAEAVFVPDIDLDLDSEDLLATAEYRYSLTDRLLSLALP